MTSSGQKYRDRRSRLIRRRDFLVDRIAERPQGPEVSALDWALAVIEENRESALELIRTEAGRHHDLPPRLGVI